MNTKSNQSVNPYYDIFGLKGWPVKSAGRVPNAYEINCAFALLGKTRPTKNVLAVAAYLRPDMGPFNTRGTIGIAVGKCGAAGGSIGKGEGDLGNCVYRDLGASPKWRDKGKAHLASIEVINGGWQLKLTKAGQALIKHLEAPKADTPQPVETLTGEPAKAMAKATTKAKPKAKKPAKVEMPETAPSKPAGEPSPVEATLPAQIENNLPLAA